MRLSLLTLLLVVGAATADDPTRLLFIGQGPDDHPPTTHEYMAGLKVLEQVLKPVKHLDITIVKADGKWENGPELIDRADGIVLFASEGAKWVSLDEKRLAAFHRAAKRKAGLVGLHWGVGCKEAKDIENFVALFGACHGGPDRKHGVFETDLKPVTGHPVATGIDPFHLKDEFYYALKTAKPREAVKPVLTAKINDADEMVAWAWDRPDGGRSFGFTGLHFHDTWKRPEYRRLVGQGVLWAVHRDVPAKGLPVED